jgi:hypothetical protein
MKNKISLLLDQYLEDVGHYGEEEDVEKSLILNELKTRISSLHEGSREECANIIREFQESRPEHKELLTDFLTYIKYHNE